MSTAQPHKDFGPRLDRMLKERGMPRKELAARVRVSPNSVTNWATGRYRPDHAHTARIASALGTSIDELHGVPTASSTAFRPDVEPGVTPDAEAQRIVRALAALDLEDPLEAMRLATAPLLEVVAAAKRHAARRNGNG
jgi:transcriptional regulator with XRE-family HTH domain